MGCHGEGAAGATFSAGARNEGGADVRTNAFVLTLVSSDYKSNKSKVQARPLERKWNGGVAGPGPRRIRTACVAAGPGPVRPCFRAQSLAAAGTGGRWHCGSASGGKQTFQPPTPTLSHLSASAWELQNITPISHTTGNSNAD